MTQQPDPAVYPIGLAVVPEQYDADAIERALQALEALPGKLRATLAACKGIDQPVRAGAWTPRVLVHHLADTHLHALMRTKMALTVDKPTVPAYDVNAWAATADASADVEPSLRMLEGVHARWADLMRRLSRTEHERQWVHPSRPGDRPIWHLALLYSWHGEHHRMQIERQGGRA